MPRIDFAYCRSDAVLSSSTLVLGSTTAVVDTAEDEAEVEADAEGAAKSPALSKDSKRPVILAGDGAGPVLDEVVGGSATGTGGI